MIKMNKTILFVDDEKQILRALRRLFHKSEYTILLAESGKEALELLKEEKVDMMITDMRMPEMDGHKLLLLVKDLYPDILRIALSGYTDKKIVLSALDKNLAKIYLFKPWNNDELMRVIDSLFEFEAVLKDKNLLDLISKLSNLPTIPRLYSTISEMVEAEEPIGEISKVIEGDQAIASRILRIANSAYYGSKTGDIKQAIMFIGLVNVKNIILSNSVYQSNDSRSKRMEIEFAHSSLTNRLLNDIYSKLVKKTLPNDSKSAGLLHNIGRGVLMQNFRDLYKDEETDISQELEQLGISHQQVGAYILNWWELPLPIVESAMFHHNPNNKDIVNKQLVAVVHIAQYFAWKLLKPDAHLDLSLEALELAGVSYDQVNDYINEHYDKENSIG